VARRYRDRLVEGVGVTYLVKGGADLKGLLQDSKIPVVRGGHGVFIHIYSFRQWVGKLYFQLTHGNECRLGTFTIMWPQKNNHESLFTQTKVDEKVDEKA
jgi:hypothetical protein